MPSGQHQDIWPDQSMILEEFQGFCLQEKLATHIFLALRMVLLKLDTLKLKELSIIMDIKNIHELKVKDNFENTLISFLH